MWVQRHLVRGDHPIYMIAYFLLIVFFTYFYVSITFNPQDVADNMKKYGGFIPGIRAGRPTAEYLEYVLSASRCPARSTWRRSRSSPWSRSTSSPEEQSGTELRLRRDEHPDHRSMSDSIP